MKKFLATLLTVCTVSVYAQNSGAQYISSDKKQSPDSSKSEYRDDPAKHSHEESYTLNNGTGSGMAQNSADQSRTTNDGYNPSNNEDTVAMNSGEGYATNKDDQNNTPCEARMNWGACAGSFGLGALVGFLITWLVYRRRNTGTGAMRMNS